MAGIISIISFILSLLIIISIYFSYRKLPIVGLNIIKGTATSTTLQSIIKTRIDNNEFKGFLRVILSWNFWIELFKSFFNNTKNEVIQMFKKAIFLLMTSFVLFMTSIVTGLIQILIYIF
jgi:hypothetical protein